MAGNTVTYKGINLHPGQRRIVNELFNNDTFYNTIVAPRQCGKSVLCYNIALYYAINERKVNVLWTSPTHAQSKVAMEKIYSAIKNSGVVYQYNKTERKIILINGSTIYFSGTERADNVRGISVHYLIVDECAYTDEKAVTEVLIPTMSTVGRKAFFISTPRGRHNLFYKYYAYGEAKMDMYSSYRMDLLENPFRNVELIESERITKPSFVFRQEYLAEFLDSELSLFANLDELAIGEFEEPRIGEKYTAGLDLAQSHDYSVLTIMDSKGKVVYVYRINQVTWELIMNTVVQILTRYNKANCYVEVNSMGSPIYESLHKRYPNVHAFTTTNASKNDLIEGLILKFENKEILIPAPTIFKPMYEELQAFTFEYSPKSKTVKYSAPQGLYDDCVMSLALCVAAHNRWNKRGNFIVR